MKKLFSLAALVAAFSLLLATWPAEPARAAAGMRPGAMTMFMLPQTAAVVATGFTADRLNKFSSAPTCPVAGYLFYDTTADTVKACNNALSAAAVGTSLPALSDNLTNVISTEGIQVPAGTVTNPSLQWSETGAPAGWYRSAANDYILSVGNSVTLLRATVGGVTVNGALKFSNGSVHSVGANAFITWRAAANLSFGSADVNGVPVAQTISFQNAITGSNLAPVAATIAAPLGTGNGAGSAIKLQRAIMQATGTTAHTATDGFVVCESKTLSNTSATVQALANIALASNSAGGARGSITVTATDGTNFDSETQDFVVSYVNKATVGTVGTAAITASTAANNSGSATIGMTATFSGTTLSINATPVFTTIVPTTVTSYIELQNHGAGAVTCQ